MEGPMTPRIEGLIEEGEAFRQTARDHAAEALRRDRHRRRVRPACRSATT